MSCPLVSVETSAHNERSILEQMRLESLRGNWVRVRVGSRKVNRVYLKEPESAVSVITLRRSRR